MAAPNSIACPKCRSKLKLAAAPAPGKKLRCPKCQTVFSVPAAAPTVDEDPYPGSVVIDEDAMRFTAEFTSPPNPAHVAGMLRGAPGLTLQSGTRIPAASGGSTTDEPFYVSLYYESYTGNKPVSDLFREVVEALPGYVADSLEHDEEAHHVTFQMSGVARRVDLSTPLRFSGLSGYTYSIGSESKSVEELKKSRRPERRAPGGR